MENRKVRVLTIKYDGDIDANEIVCFRGAVIGAMKDKANTLYHNHLDDNSLRYSYPLIQYKRIGTKAAIVCVGEGTDVIGQFISEDYSGFQIGDRFLNMNIANIQPSKILVQIWNSFFQYSIRNWLPFNSQNYNRYLAIDSAAERIQFLESILKGNMLSFAKGVNIMITETIEVKINSISEPKSLKCKGVKRMGFDVKFKSNLSIPNHIGLGKNASLGFGTVVAISEKENNKH